VVVKIARRRFTGLRVYGRGGEAKVTLE